MALYDCTCTVTGGPGILDDCAGTCCCRSPLIAIFCDGTMKNMELWKDYRGIGEPPERPPGATKLSDHMQEVLDRYDESQRDG
jgi:hypothetical protein